MGTIRIACTTTAGAPFDLPEDFFDLPPKAVFVDDPMVAICKDGIAVAYAIAIDGEEQYKFKDGPHPAGVVPPTDAPSTREAIARMQQAFAASRS